MNTKSENENNNRDFDSTLQKGDEAFFTVFHASPFPLSISKFDDGTFIEVNKEFQTLSGWTRDEIIGSDPLKLNVWVHIDDRTRMRNALETAGCMRNEEMQFRTKSGRIITVLGFAEKVMIRGVAHILICATDITNRKKAELSLCESEDKFAKAFHSSPVAMAISTVSENRFLNINEEYLKMTGYCKQEIIGRTMDDLNICDTSIALKSMPPGSIAQKAPHNIDIAVRRKSGEVLTTIWSAELIYVGGVACILSSFYDVTQQRKIMADLAESEEKFRTFIEQNREAVVLVDENGDVIEWNGAFEALSGIPRIEALGRPFWELVFALTSAKDQSLELHEQQKRFIQTALKTGDFNRLSAPFETEILRPDGKYVIVQQSLFPIKTSRGFRFGAVYRDITEKKKFEDALTNAEKLESLGILAGGIAHDFNNLLTGVFGYIDLARMFNAAGAHDKVSQNLSKALDVFNRTRALTQQLLTFSKGGMPVKKTVSLASIIISATQFVLSGSSVSPHFAFPDDLWPCDIDENQFGQVLDNIIINARQAMPTGGSIVVFAENIVHGAPIPSVLKPGNYVRISIKDFGTGISKEHLPHIFDPFFTTKQEGSGLGLATSYSIMRKHDGMIDVDSVLGKGTTFFLYLPANPSENWDNGYTSAKKHCGNGTILVMDDEEYILDVAGQMLASLGYSTEFAATIDEAVVKYRIGLQTNRYKAVILDLTIPGSEGGKEALRKLFEMDQGVIAIASSGYSNDPIMAAPRKYGFADKLKKPYAQTELADIFERIFPTKTP